MAKLIQTEKDFIKAIIKWLKTNHVQDAFSFDELNTIKDEYRNLWTNINSLESFELENNRFVPTAKTVELLQPEVMKLFKKQAKVLLKKHLDDYLIKFFKKNENKIVTLKQIMQDYEKEERLAEDLISEYRLELRGVIYRLITTFRQKLSLKNFTEGYLISITSASARKVKSTAILDSGWIFSSNLKWAFQYLEEQRQKHLKTVAQFDSLIGIIKENLPVKEREHIESEFENNSIKLEMIETVSK